MRRGPPSSPASEHAAFPERLCVGLACIGGRAGKPGLLQVVYTLRGGRHAFVMATGVTYSASKHAEEPAMRAPRRVSRGDAAAWAELISCARGSAESLMTGALSMAVKATAGRVMPVVARPDQCVFVALQGVARAFAAAPRARRVRMAPALATMAAECEPLLSPAAPLRPAPASSWTQRADIGG